MTEIAPDMLVKDAMNDIERKKRERAAAQQSAEAKKVMVVMAAEAEKEARKLNGEGMADENKAFIEGLKESVCQFVSLTLIRAPVPVLRVCLCVRS